MNSIALSDAFKFIDCRGKSPNKASSGIPLLTAKNVKKGFISVDPKEFLSVESYDDWIKRGIPAEGDLLFTTEAPLGNVALLPKYEKVVVAQRVISLSPKIPLETSFYKWWMLSQYFQKELDRRSTGSTAKGIRSKELAKIQIPLPPLAQQKKIAAILDAADAYRQKTKALIAKYDELSQSLFLDMFGDPVTNPMEWEKSKAEPYIDLITGNAFKSKDYSNNARHTRLCGGLIIMPWGIEWSSCNTWNPNATKGLDKYWLQTGDIVMAMDRPWITSGFKICVLTPIDTPSLLVQRTARIRTSKLNNIFLYYLYKSKAFERHAKPTETTVPHISPKDIRSYKLIFPPQKLQNQFAERIEAIEAQKAQAQDSLAKAEELFASLLQRAFKGELT